METENTFLDVFSFHNSIFNGISVIKHTLRDSPAATFNSLSFLFFSFFILSSPLFFLLSLFFNLFFLLLLLLPPPIELPSHLCLHHPLLPLPPVLLVVIRPHRIVLLNHQRCHPNQCQLCRLFLHQRWHC